MTNEMIVALSWTFGAIIIVAFLAYLWFYKIKKRQVFSTKKIVIYGAFFAIFLIQNALWIPLSHLPVIPWSMDSVTVIAIGFLFGPLEAMVYGFIADLFGALISGWAPLPIYMLKYPITGLVSGVLGDVYKSKFKINDSYSFIILQVVIAIFVVTPIVIANTNQDALDESGVSEALVYSAAAVSFVLFEALGIYFVKKKDKKQFMLFVFVALAAVISRIVTGWLIQTMADTYYWGYPFELSMLARIITSSYLTPATALISYGIISSSIYAMKVVNY